MKLDEVKPLNILFINAINRFNEVENRYPPLWPAYLAAYLEKKLNKKLFNFKYMKGNFLKDLKSFKPEIIVISCVTQNYQFAINYSEIAKKYNCKVIIGGIHITSMPYSLKKEMDIGVVGEGEQTFFEIIDHYLKFRTFKNKFLKKINGIIFWDNDKIVKTQDRAPFKTLEEIPIPKFDLVGFHYRGYIYTARGCAYKCVFCICSRYWGKIRYASAERVLTEIEYLISKGVKVIRFADENFTGNIKRLKEIARLIEKKGINKKVKFSCWCRANTINQEVVTLLKTINIVSVKLGLESGCQKTLDYLKGNVTVGDNKRAVLLLKKAGMQVNGDFVIGSPDETEEEMMETYQFIKKMPLDFIDINIFTAYPGTAVWDYAFNKKIVSNDIDWKLINIKIYDTKEKSIILSNNFDYFELYHIYKKFKRLRYLKMVKSLIYSPWKKEFFQTFLKKIVEKLMKLLIKN